MPKTGAFVILVVKKSRGHFRAEIAERAFARD
jgi:hypothetical protein